MSHHTSKTDDDFDWQRNKVLSLLSIDEAFGRLKDRVLTGLSAKHDEAGDQGGRYRLEAPMSLQQAMVLMQEQLGHLLVLEPATVAAIENESSE